MRTLALIALIAMIAYSAQITNWCASQFHPEITTAWCQSVCGTSDVCFYGSAGYCHDCVIVQSSVQQWCWINGGLNPALNYWCQAACPKSGIDCHPYNAYCGLCPP